MISISNETPSGDNYPASFSGDITLQKVDQNSTEYKFEVSGLRDNAFTFWIPKSEAGGSTVDYELVAYWLMNQVESASGGSNLSSGEISVVFDLNNVSSGVATLDVSGDYICRHLSLEEEVFSLKIQGIGGNYFDIEVPQNEAGGNSWPDPGDVFRWLMEKLKELVCPNCL